MNKVLNGIFIVMALFTVVFGFIIVERYLQATNSVRGMESQGKFNIETIKISNIPVPPPKVKEICYFETQKDVDNWVSDGAYTKLSLDHVSQGAHSMEIKWEKENSYRLFYFHFPEDWQNYDHFAFDVYNTLNEPSAVSIIVYDYFETGRFGSRLGHPFLMRYELKPGWNTLKTGIKDMQKKINAASGKKLIHLYFSDRGAVYYIDNMRLER